MRESYAHERELRVSMRGRAGLRMRQRELKA